MSEGGSLKVLLVMEHPGVGSLMPALRLLDEQGHQLHFAYDALKSVESQRELQSLAEDCPGITFGRLPVVENAGTVALASWLRRSIDYLRYLEPRYRDATKLRRRAARKSPRATRRIARVVGITGPLGITGLRRGLQALERCLTPPPQIVRYLEEQQPDVLLPAHLLPIGTPHADYLRAAKRLGIRTVFPVRGWDNLTNKGLLRDAPDQMLVWNDLQAKEAVELHRVPAGQISLTGAPLCDPWFDFAVTRSREEFCDEVGLRADRPIVLYMCSSGFVAVNEVDFVRSWIGRLRARGGPMAEAGFLVRPHPLNAAQWADADLGDDHARVWPRFGEAPHDEASKQNYFDSIYHSAVVVGINTTAQIESAIVGRPVHTLLAEEFRETQQGTLHFHYLKADEFGLLHVGRTFEEHAEQLDRSLAGHGDDGRNERFLRRFVRPRGLEHAATELLAQAIVELGSKPAPAPDRGPVLAPVVRVALAPWAALARRGSTRRGERRTSRATPIYELRQTLRKRATHRTGAPVVAGPWLGDETGELLYWIPFLRWAMTAGPGLSERLFVVSRAAGASWYAGIGAGLVSAEHLAPDGPGEITEAALQAELRPRVVEAFGFGSRAFRVLPTDTLAGARVDLANQRPKTRLERRMLDFAPLVPAETADEPELPREFFAVHFDAEHARIGSAFADDHQVVNLDGLDRETQAVVLARSRGFVGTYGTEAVLAVLAGVQAVAFSPAQGPLIEADLTLISSFLSAPPYGRLQVLEAAGPPSESAGRAASLLDAPIEALATV